MAVDRLKEGEYRLSGEALAEVGHILGLLTKTEDVLPKNIIGVD